MQVLIQGDVILKKLENLPETATLVQKDVKILQESEVTGHHHHFRDTGIDLYQLADENVDKTMKTITPNLGKVIKLDKATKLYHGTVLPNRDYDDKRGDHAPIEVPAGIYYIDIVREYDYDANETVRVVD